MLFDILDVKNSIKCFQPLQVQILPVRGLACDASAVVL